MTIVNVRNSKVQSADEAISSSKHKTGWRGWESKILPVSDQRVPYSETYCNRFQFYGKALRTKDSYASVSIVDLAQLGISTYVIPLGVSLFIPDELGSTGWDAE